MSDAAPALGTHPSGLPPTNLADALAPPDRGSRLAGRLAPTRPSAARPSGIDTAAPSAGPARSEPRPARIAAAEERPAGGPARGAARPVIVYLPVSLRDRLRQLTAERDLTYTELVLDAVDATHERLPSLLTPEKPRARSLFRQPTAPRRRRHAEPHVQVSLRLVPEDLAVIDQLVTDLDAGSRSHLVATALQAHLQ
jgi:hypothetical protein